MSLSSIFVPSGVSFESKARVYALICCQTIAVKVKTLTSIWFWHVSWYILRHVTSRYKFCPKLRSSAFGCVVYSSYSLIQHVARSELGAQGGTGKVTCAVSRVVLGRVMSINIMLKNLFPQGDHISHLPRVRVLLPLKMSCPPIPTSEKFISLPLPISSA